MIGKRFREHRAAMGMTQEELARRLFVSQPMVAQVEAGVKMPTVGMVRLAAEAFGCTTDELILDLDEQDSVCRARAQDSA